MDNPYAASEVDAAAVPLTSDRAVDSNNRSLMTIARSTFLAWELLRIVYVGLLGAFTLLLVGWRINEVRIAMLVFEGAIAANLAFFAGPTVETYLRWLGVYATWMRWVLFVGGTLLTAALAFGALAMTLLPNQ